MRPYSGQVLVTGATGFVGCALIPQLQASGWRVRATGRDAARCPPGCEFIAADLAAAPDWDSLVKDVRAVVHLAARVHVMHEQAADPLADFRGANVLPSLRLAEVAARHGVEQFVFASTVKVNGERTTKAPFTEGDAPRPEDAYGVSKLEAERALAEVSDSTGLRVTILRPPLMYGPGVKGNFERLLRLVRRRIPLPLGAVRNRRSLLFVGNFGSAVATALQQPENGTRTFLVSDGEDVSTADLVRRIARAAGRRAWLLPVPISWLQLGARAAGREAELQRLTESLRVDSSRIRAQLGWVPPYTLDQGLSITLKRLSVAYSRDRDG